MRTLVVDASVGAKWLLPSAGEPLVVEAETLLDLYARGHVRFLIPDLFWAEIGNVVWKAVVRGRMTARDAERAVDKVLQYAFPSIPAVDLLQDALSVALGHHRTVYDSIYVAAALSAKAELVTADEKLASGLGVRFPVRWLGALSNFR